jgi:hypothetical protein
VKLKTKEMTMINLNLKAVASAFGALALTLVLSWTFVDSTSLARVQREAGFVAAVSALVR